MLTSDLLRVKTTKNNEVIPRTLDPESEAAQDKAAELTEIFREGEGHERGAIDEAVEAVIGYGTDFLIWRGLAKLLYDRSTFETVAEADPSEIRRAVFEASADLGPVTSDEVRQAVLERAANALEITPEGCDAGLYADLQEHQRLTEHKPLKGGQLVHRYNLAMAQAVLYKATKLEVTLLDEDPNKLRYLFQSLKFFGLMHRAWRTDRGWRLEIDGPASLFSKSRKYGLQMAKFLPALVLLERWELVADLDWESGKTHTLTLTHADGLVSHYTAQGQWKSDEEKMLEDRWTRLDTEWTLERKGTLMELDRGEVLIPDYVLTHPDGRVVYAEVVGFWRRSYLERRIEMLDALEDEPLVLIVAEKLNSGQLDLDDVPTAIVFFKTVILVDKVLDAVEHVSKR